MEVIAGGPSDAFLLQVPDTRLIGHTPDTGQALLQERLSFYARRRRSNIHARIVSWWECEAEGGVHRGERERV
jgi:hypothetical protein